MELDLLLVALDPTGGCQQQFERGLVHHVVVASPWLGDGFETAGQAGAGLGVGQAATGARPGVDLALHLGVREHTRDTIGPTHKRHLLAGGEGAGIGSELMHRHDAWL